MRFGQTNCFQRLWKVAQSPINRPTWSYMSPQDVFLIPWIELGGVSTRTWCYISLCWPHHFSVTIKMIITTNEGSYRVCLLACLLACLLNTPDAVRHPNDASLGWLVFKYNILVASKNRVFANWISPIFRHSRFFGFNRTLASRKQDEQQCDQMFVHKVAQLFAKRCPKSRQSPTFRCFKYPKMSPNSWLVMTSKFVTKNFQKSPHLVTLIQESSWAEGKRETRFYPNRKIKLAKRNHRALSKYTRLCSLRVNSQIYVSLVINKYSLG